MKKLISCCGLDCATCDAWKSTISNDDEMRKATVEKWKAMYNAPGLTYTMINCTGCREEGAKFSHCFECNIRNCVRGRGYDTCADCDDLEKCEIVAFIHRHVPEALANLKDIRSN